MTNLWISVMVGLAFAGMGTPVLPCLGRRIDVHTHFIPPFYRSYVDNLNISNQAANPPWSVYAHLSLMDDIDVDFSILSVTEPGARFSADDVAEGRIIARRLNRYGYNLARKYPNKFGFFATLTLPDVEGSISEAIYALDELKAAGIKVDSNSVGVYIGDRRFDPLMDVLNERNTTIFVHPTRAPNTENLDPLGLPSKVLDFEVDIGRAALNLVKNNILERYPNLNFHIAHMGGFIPFQAYRICWSLTLLPSMNATVLELLQRFQSFYYDISTVYSRAGITSMTGFVPPTKILFGSDWPFGKVTLDILQPLDTDPNLNATQQHQIMLMNALSLYSASIHGVEVSLLTSK